jgi:hypothetical protein
MADINDDYWKMYQQWNKSRQSSKDDLTPISYKNGWIHPDSSQWISAGLTNVLGAPSKPDAQPEQYTYAVDQAQELPSSFQYNAEARVSNQELNHLEPQHKLSLLLRWKNELLRMLGDKIAKDVKIKSSTDYDGVTMRASVVVIDADRLERYVQYRIEKAIQKYRDDEE